jgi:hypothetical protein
VLRGEEADYQRAKCNGTLSGPKPAVVAGKHGGKGAKKGVRKEV